MNPQKRVNINIDMKSLRKNHQKTITKKSSIDSFNNLYIIPKKEQYQTIVIKQSSNQFHSKPKKTEKKPSSCCIKNRKSLKSAGNKFKNQKNKNFKDVLYDLLSLSSSGESLYNKKKSNDKKDITHNTINAINHRLKIFNNKYINHIKTDNKIKYKSIETTHSKCRHMNYKNNNKNNNKGDKSSRKKNLLNLKESDNNNIIINFFNAPISKYNKEYYINNFTNNNINNNNINNNNINNININNNNIYKDKQQKKNVLQILNHTNNLNSNYNSNNNKDYKNLFPIFSYINTGNNNININNINNYNEIENPINKSKTRKRCNTSENLMPLSNSNNIYNSQDKINNGKKTKKNSINKDSKEKYYHKYNKIKEKNKFIKNKRLQNLPPQIKIVEDMLLKVEDKKNRLKNIIKNNNNNTINNNINNNNINKSLSKNNNINNIKHEYFIHSNTINNESSHKNKANVYTFLTKVITSIEKNNNNKNSKNKKNHKYINQFMKNEKDIGRINTIKSIDIEDNKKRTPKFNNLMSKIFPFQKENKNYKNDYFSNIEKIYSNNNRVFVNNQKSQSKKNQNFNTIMNNNINVLSNRASHFNISNTKYNTNNTNKKKYGYNPRKTIENQKREKSNNAIKIKTNHVGTENNLKNKKNTKTEENLNLLMKNIDNINTNTNNINTNNINNDFKKTLTENIATNTQDIKKNNIFSKVIDINEIENADPQYVEEYLEEILCNLFLEEKIYLEKIGFQMSSDFLNNYGINPETRTCLIDSLIDLQKIFNFNERTLFITVQLFDRFLTTSIVKNLSKVEEDDLDIILTTSLLIASKIEESILYKLTDYLGILSDKYTTNNIIEMEDRILKVINFNVVVPTMLDFFEVFAQKCKLNQEEKNKGLFLLNIVLLDINLSQISGSVIAYSIITIVTGKNCNFLLKKINQIIDKRNEKNKESLDSFFLLNNKEKIDELCELINVFSKGILKTEYNHVYKKYNCEKFGFVSKMMGEINDDNKDTHNSYNS